MLNKWSLSLLNFSYSYGKKVSLKVNITSLEENRGKYRQPLRIDVVERNSCIGWVVSKCPQFKCSDVRTLASYSVFSLLSCELQEKTANRRYDCKTIPESLLFNTVRVWKQEQSHRLHMQCRHFHTHNIHPVVILFYMFSTLSSWTVLLWLWSWYQMSEPVFVPCSVSILHMEKQYDESTGWHRAEGVDGGNRRDVIRAEGE